MKKTMIWEKPITPEPCYNDDKELFAFYGLASYYANIIEQGIANLYVGLRINNLSQEEIEKYYIVPDSNTFGYMIKEIKKYITFDEDFDYLIAYALKIRNFLIHHFFSANSEALVHEAGRKLMTDILKNVIVFFKQVDKQLDVLWVDKWSEYGLTKEIIDYCLEKEYPDFM